MYDKERVFNKLKEDNYELISNHEIFLFKDKIHVLDLETNYKSVILFGKYITDRQKPCWFSNRNPYTIENIKIFLDNNFDNLELVSTSYKNADSYLIVNCKEHGEYKSTWSNLIQGYGCKKCANVNNGIKKRTSVEIVKNDFIEMGYTPIFEDDEYKNRHSELVVLDSNGYKISTNYMNLCSIKKNKISEKLFAFHQNNKYTIDNIRKWLKDNGHNHIELISKEYISAQTHLELYCNTHNMKLLVTWNNISAGKICKECGNDKVRGENNSNYNPNLTQEERELRRFYIGKDSYVTWRRKVFERDNYCCAICGQKGYLNAHHLDGWN